MSVNVSPTVSNIPEINLAALEGIATRKASYATEIKDAVAQEVTNYLHSFARWARAAGDSDVDAAVAKVSSVKTLGFGRIFSARVTDVLIGIRA